MSTPTTTIPTPPDELNFVGPGGFTFVGEQFFRILTEVAGLRPEHRVLDMGCGIGRMAIPLSGFIDGRGSYEGLDIVRLGIDWCDREIASRHPRFRFHHANVFNRGYNPGGRTAADVYRFPFPDADFDFVFLTSVFTHMLPRDVENYIAEISRVLKVGGRCLATFYLRNDECERLGAEGRHRIQFKHREKDYWTTNRRAPEDLIGFDEHYVRDRFAANGFAVVEPIHFGKWTGRTGTLSYQDILIAQKEVAGQLAYPSRSLRQNLTMLARRLLHIPLQKFFWRSETIVQVERAQKAARSRRAA